MFSVLVLHRKGERGRERKSWQRAVVLTILIRVVTRFGISAFAENKGREQVERV